MQTYTAVQTEEILPGDVIPNWMGDRPATVTAVSAPNLGRIRVRTDSSPSYRFYRTGRTISVIRGGAR